MVSRFYRELHSVSDEGLCHVSTDTDCTEGRSSLLLICIIGGHNVVVDSAWVVLVNHN